MRAHFQGRYDHRRNLVDWDYQFGIKDFTKTVNQQEYRGWRLNGIGFETRLATGTIPNRTMGSFVEGKTRKGHDSIMVRGFWGDIINSPYFSFGNEIWKEPERTRFLKEVNYQRVYSNADISEYNVQSYIHKLEEMTDYDYPFERLRSILGDQYDNPKDKAKAEAYKKQQEEEKKKKEKQDDEEPMIKEIDEEEEKQIEQDKKKAQGEEKKA